MRHILRAREDVNRRIGDRVFAAKKGETIELSGAGAEIALAGGDFEFVEDVPETESEKAAAKEKAKAEKLAESLAKTPKEKLVKKAEKLGVDAGLKKDELVTEIVDATINADAGEVKG